MSAKKQEIIKIFSGRRILIAVLLGIAVSIYLIIDDFSFKNYENINLGYAAIAFLTLAILLEAIRDIAYYV